MLADSEKFSSFPPVSIIRISIKIIKNLIFWSKKNELERRQFLDASWSVWKAYRLESTKGKQWIYCNWSVLNFGKNSTPPPTSSPWECFVPVIPRTVLYSFVLVFCLSVGQFKFAMFPCSPKIPRGDSHCYCSATKSNQLTPVIRSHTDRSLSSLQKRRIF